MSFIHQTSQTERRQLTSPPGACGAPEQLGSIQVWTTVLSEVMLLNINKQRLRSCRASGQYLFVQHACVSQATLDEALCLFALCQTCTFYTKSWRNRQNKLQPILTVPVLLISQPFYAVRINLRKYLNTSHTGIFKKFQPNHLFSFIIISSIRSTNHRLLGERGLAQRELEISF